MRTVKTVTPTDRQLTEALLTLALGDGTPADLNASDRAALVHDRVEAAGPRAANTGVTVSARLEPVHVRGDEVLLRQAADNLLPTRSSTTGRTAGSTSWSPPVPPPAGCSSATGRVVAVEDLDELSEHSTGAISVACPPSQRLPDPESSQIWTSAESARDQVDQTSSPARCSFRRAGSPNPSLSAYASEL